MTDRLGYLTNLSVSSSPLARPTPRGARVLRGKNRDVPAALAHLSPRRITMAPNLPGKLIMLTGRLRW